jgi:ABC-2 type transport system ATP-binding protein
MQAEAAVRLDRLVRRFAELTAVDELTFEVGRGELFGLVGPDGAGKTTTLRMLAGVLRPTSGDAVVLGHSIATEPEAAKPHIAYMSQRFGLYEDLTVQENLDFYADLYDVPGEERARRLDRLFRFSGLAPFKDRLAGKLSGGMKQKLGLSCALIHQPELLLLDEPTFGVDPISRRDLWLIVHEMVAQGVTVIVSTAYMDEAERLDRVALLYDGRLLALEEPRALQQTLAGRLLSVQVAHPRQARRELARQPEVRWAAVFGDRVHAAVDDVATAVPALQSALTAAGFPDPRLTEQPPSMEDVFMDRTARVTSGPADGG